MVMTYNFNRTDRNQKEIARGLRAIGYSVRFTHMVKKGFPDMVIGKHGFSLLVENKMPGEPLTPDEREFFDSWNGAAIIGESVEHIDAQFTKLFKIWS
jgi:hypothetical protein